MPHISRTRKPVGSDVRFSVAPDGAVQHEQAEPHALLHEIVPVDHYIRIIPEAFPDFCRAGSHRIVAGFHCGAAGAQRVISGGIPFRIGIIRRRALEEELLCAGQRLIFIDQAALRVFFLAGKPFRTLAQRARDGKSGNRSRIPQAAVRLLSLLPLQEKADGIIPADLLFMRTARAAGQAEIAHGGDDGAVRRADAHAVHQHMYVGKGGKALKGKVHPFAG